MGHYYSYYNNSVSLFSVVLTLFLTYCFFFLQDAFAGEDFTPTGKDFMSPGEMYDSEQDELETCKPVFL